MEGSRLLSLILAALLGCLICGGAQPPAGSRLVGTTEGSAVFQIPHLDFSDLNSSGSPFRTLAWLFGLGNIVLYSGGVGFVFPAYERRISLNTSTGALELRGLSLSDSGLYTVDITTLAGLQLNASTRLDVYAPPSVVNISSGSSVLVESSSSVRLSCSSSGSTLSFLWMNSSSEVAASDRVQFGDGGSALTIVNVTRYDRGPYMCKVSNPVGNGTSHTLALEISYGPEQVAIVGPSSAVTGGVTLLYCSATSAPPPSFAWLFNGAPTDTLGAVHVLASSLGSDAGTYTCTARNQATGLTQTVHHALSVKSADDCSAAVGRTVAVSVGCSVSGAAVIGAVVFSIIRRMRSE